jgi:hypothetical protein
MRCRCGPGEQASLHPRPCPPRTLPLLESHLETKLPASPTNPCASVCPSCTSSTLPPGPALWLTDPASTSRLLNSRGTGPATAGGGPSSGDRSRSATCLSEAYGSSRAWGRASAAGSRGAGGSSGGLQGAVLRPEAAARAARTHLDHRPGQQRLRVQGAGAQAQVQVRPLPMPSGSRLGVEAGLEAGQLDVCHDHRGLGRRRPRPLGLPRGGVLDPGRASCPRLPALRVRLRGAGQVAQDGGGHGHGQGVKAQGGDDLRYAVVLQKVGGRRHRGVSRGPKVPCARGRRTRLLRLTPGALPRRQGQAPAADGSRPGTVRQAKRITSAMRCSLSDPSSRVSCSTRTTEGAGAPGGCRPSASTCTPSTANDSCWYTSRPSTDAMAAAIDASLPPGDALPLQPAGACPRALRSASRRSSTARAAANSPPCTECAVAGPAARRTSGCCAPPPADPTTSSTPIA